MTHDKGSDLAAGLLAAQNHSGVDTVKVGPGTYNTATGFSYNFSDPVHIEGSGGRFSGPSTAPVLVDTAANPSSVTLLKVLGNTASTVSGIDVSIPGGSGSGNTGIDTSGTVDNVLVQPAAGQTPSDLATGVVLEAGGALTRSDVLLTLDVNTTAIDDEGASVSIRDSRLQASTDLSSGSGTNTASIRQSRLDFGQVGVNVFAGSVTVDDSLAVAHAEAGGAPSGLAVVVAAGGTSSIAANHTTLVGAPSAGVGVDATNVASGQASITFRNGIISGFGSRLRRAATGSGQANLTTDHSDYPSGTQSDSGPGSLMETNHLTSVPGFVSATDYHLRADSPLIDAGDPAALAAGEPTTDLDGQPRVVDGDGDCSARRDIGAYEFQPGPRAPHATAGSAPATALTGQAVTFDSAGSCDPDADALSYSWTFDDGGGAPGASVQRTFSTPGLHFGTVAVTDPSGRSATATASVVVAFPPFAGVAIGAGKVRASKKGVLKVKVSCPLGTAGLCAGTLSVDGGKAAFSIPPGAQRSVAVKLPKSKLKLLRKKRKQKLTATAAARDANGTPKTSTVKLTLLAPH